MAEGSWTDQPVQLIMIISTAIQKSLPKSGHIPLLLSIFILITACFFSGWIKKIAPAVKTGETSYSRNHEHSYYDAIPSVCKRVTVIKRREVMYDIGQFTMETPHGTALWTKQNVLSIICFFPLDQIPKIKYAIRL